MKINFITNLAEGSASGGFSARNQAAFRALKSKFDVAYVGPINPPAALDQKIASKIPRIFGRPGAFFFFSERRLAAIDDMYRATPEDGVDMDFFHGFTPWIRVAPKRRYIAWNDCTFHDYMNIHQDRRKFHVRDVNRIEDLEASWLSKAECIIFRSKFFCDRAIDHYKLDPRKVRHLANFGAIDVPNAEPKLHNNAFIFVSTNFQIKGGKNFISAFDVVRSKHPGLKAVIVGDCPAEYRKHVGVDVVGFLDKKIPDHKAKLTDIYSQAVAIVHPTSMDTNPAVIIEAAYFGCPAIATQAFAIPEFVTHGKSGFLLGDASDVSKIAEHMSWMLEHPNEYEAMRRWTQQRALAEFTPKAFEDKLVAIVEDVMGLAA